MTAALDTGGALRSRRQRERLRQLLVEASSIVLGIVLLIWALAPLYTMVLIALDPEDGEIEFEGNFWPPEPSLESFRTVVMQGARYLEEFWQQFGNSVFICLMTTVLTLLIGSLASYTVDRLRLGKGALLTNAALFTYAIPASFLIVPYYRIMHSYGLADGLWSVIARGCSLIGASGSSWK
jgi:multiple sugar transport system permease protein